MNSLLKGASNVTLRILQTCARPKISKYYVAITLVHYKTLVNKDISATELICTEFRTRFLFEFDSRIEWTTRSLTSNRAPIGPSSRYVTQLQAHTIRYQICTKHAQLI